MPPPTLGAEVRAVASPHRFFPRQLRLRRSERYGRGQQTK